jgi:hypothetical protein
MSKYTTEIRFILENAYGLRESAEYVSVDSIISQTRGVIFDFNYPIFDVNYKAGLESKILKHFYLREIGQETVGLFKLFLNRKMNEIMPYYNQLYLSELIEFNPLYTVNLTKDHHVDDVTEEGGTRNSTTDQDTTSTVSENGSNESDSTSSTTGSVNDRTDVGHSSSDRVIFSDTPQSNLEYIEDGTYATTATFEAHSYNDGTDFNEHTSNSGTGHSEGEYSRTNSGSGTLDETQSMRYTNNRDNDNDYLGHTVGYSGQSASKSLLEYRKTFLNIDMMIIDELESLFFSLY